jgi:hypothetical protein
MFSRHSFTAPLWEYGGESAWFFVTLPPDVSTSIRDMPRAPRQGFGSIRVAVTVGSSEWMTSIFPDSKSGCFILPMKRSVRSAEGIETGSDVRVSLETLD